MSTTLPWYAALPIYVIAYSAAVWVAAKAIKAVIGIFL